MMNDSGNSQTTAGSNLRMTHVLLSVITYTIVFIYCVFKFEAYSMAIAYSFVVTVIYLFTAFANAHYLIPCFYSSRKLKYVLLSGLFLVCVTGARMVLEYFLFFRLMDYKWFFHFNQEHFSFSFVTVFVAFVFGALLRITLNHIELLKLEQQRKNFHAAAELNLLKAQVQPHFLFNALNNIYYLAHAKSDKASESIARLSDTMRYFVEVAPKEFVSLEAELDFIQDYIEVERIRLAGQLAISWDKNLSSSNIFIPPMLFIPLIENVFKHGIDKTRDNEIWITLYVIDQELTFAVKNKLIVAASGTKSGNGLTNLRKRLSLLYNHQFSLTVVYENGYFVSQLKIPVA
jgi:sensor histidine kinase YesM